MKKLSFCIALAGYLALIAPPLLAHHGRGATYDMKKKVSLKATVAEVLWRNPHIAIVLDAPDESGKMVRWTIEHSNITTLVRQGYGRNTLKAGQDLTAVIYPGADGSPIGLCARFILPDGKVIFDRGADVD